MNLNEKTRDELEQIQREKEDELQKCLDLLSEVAAKKREIKKKILAARTITARLSEELETWLEAVEKASFNKEKINSELREVRDYIYKRLRGE